MDEVETLPAGVASDLIEADRCCSAKAYRGAALLARRAVEQAVVLRGVPVTKRSLHQKLAWALDEGHLLPPWRAAAVTVRDIGNAAAHGAEPVTADEAHAVVEAALAVAVALTGDPSARI